MAHIQKKKSIGYLYTLKIVLGASTALFSLIFFNIYPVQAVLPDNFDDYIVGDISGQGDWTKIGGFNKFYVSAATSTSGTKSLQLQTGGASTYKNTIDPATTFEDCFDWKFAGDLGTTDSLTLNYVGSSSQVKTFYFAKDWFGPSATNSIDIFDQGYNQVYIDYPIAGDWDQFCVRFKVSDHTYSWKLSDGAYSPWFDTDINYWTDIRSIQMTIGNLDSNGYIDSMGYEESDTDFDETIVYVVGNDLTANYAALKVPDFYLCYTEYPCDLEYYYSEPSIGYTTYFMPYIIGQMTEEYATASTTLTRQYPLKESFEINYNSDNFERYGILLVATSSTLYAPIDVNWIEATTTYDVSLACSDMEAPTSTGSFLSDWSIDSLIYVIECAFRRGSYWWFEPRPETKQKVYTDIAVLNTRFPMSLYRDSTTFIDSVNAIGTTTIQIPIIDPDGNLIGNLIDPSFRNLEGHGLFDLYYKTAEKIMYMIFILACLAKIFGFSFGFISAGSDEPTIVRYEQPARKRRVIFQWGPQKDDQIL